jgi:Putative auto-transporter adhesin, head GIN domain
MRKSISPFLSRAVVRFSVVFLLAACTQAVAAAEDGSWFSRIFGPSTVGSGNVKSENRTATGFQEVAAGGSMKVLLRQSGREGVEVSADDNLLPLIETRVSNGTLVIELKRGANYTSRNPVTVTVDFIALKSLSLGGSATISGASIKGSKLGVSIGGSGSVKLSDVQLSALDVSIGGSGSFAATGRSPKLSISIGGSGGALTEQLDADDVTVSVAGSGGAVVKANRTLDASVAGSGDVVYSGDAVARTSKAGSGTVTKR